MEKEQVLDISWGTIAKIFVAIFIFYFIYLTREIVLWFFFALAVSVLLDPAINFIKKFWIPRIIAVLLVYFSIFGVLGLLIYLSAPVFNSEMHQFVQYLPGYFEQISPILNQFGINTAQNFNDFTSTLSGNLQQSSQSIIKAIMIFFGGLASAAFIMTVSFFLSLEENSVERILLLICPAKFEDQIKNILKEFKKKLPDGLGQDYWHVFLWESPRI